MRRRLISALAVASLVAVVGLAGTPAQAAKSRTLVFNVDLISSGTTLETLPGGITYGWNDLRGPTKWGKASAQLRFLGSVDYVDGTGPFGGFVTITRSDGVKLALSVSGWATSPPEQGTANATFRGTVTVIGGSGPFAGATGTGTMSGYRKAALGSPVELTFSVTVQTKK
jgi:hypothetical protein